MLLQMLTRSRSGNW